MWLVEVCCSACKPVGHYNTPLLSLLGVGAPWEPMQGSETALLRAIKGYRRLPTAKAFCETELLQSGHGRWLPSRAAVEEACSGGQTLTCWAAQTRFLWARRGIRLCQDPEGFPKRSQSQRRCNPKPFQTCLQVVSMTHVKQQARSSARRRI